MLSFTTKNEYIQAKLYPQRTLWPPRHQLCLVKLHPRLPATHTHSLDDVELGVLTGGDLKLAWVAVSDTVGAADRQLNIGAATGAFPFGGLLGGGAIVRKLKVLPEGRICWLVLRALGSLHVALVRVHVAFLITHRVMDVEAVLGTVLLLRSNRYRSEIMCD